LLWRFSVSCCSFWHWPTPDPSRPAPSSPMLLTESVSVSCCSFWHWPTPDPSRPAPSAPMLLLLRSSVSCCRFWQRATSLPASWAATSRKVMFRASKVSIPRKTSHAVILVMLGRICSFRRGWERLAACASRSGVRGGCCSVTEWNGTRSWQLMTLSKELLCRRWRCWAMWNQKAQHVAAR